MCACLCVRAFLRACVCVSVCVCARARACARVCVNDCTVAEAEQDDADVGKHVTERNGTMA